MTTADLQVRRFPLCITVAELRQLAEALVAMEHAPHDGPARPDKQIEQDRAGEQLATHLSMLLVERRGEAEEAKVEDSLPLIRVSAKYLLTACDRLRRTALTAALRAGSGPGNDQAQRTAAAVREVLVWDGIMSRLGEGYGVKRSLRELLDPSSFDEAELARIGLRRGALFNDEDLLAPA